MSMVRSVLTAHCRCRGVSYGYTMTFWFEMSYGSTRSVKTPWEKLDFSPHVHLCECFCVFVKKAVVTVLKLIRPCFSVCDMASLCYGVDGCFGSSNVENSL